MIRRLSTTLLMVTTLISLSVVSGDRASADVRPWWGSGHECRGDYSGIDLHGYQISSACVGANFSGANLAGTLWDGFISGVDFSDADLTGAVFKSDEFKEVKFLRTNLSQAVFRNAPLGRVDSGNIIGNPQFYDDRGYPVNVELRDGHLNLGCLYGDITNFDFNFWSSPPPICQITGIPATIPSGWRVVNGILLSPGGPWATRDTCDLSNSNLSDFELHGSLAGCSISGSNLDGADLSSGYIGNLETGGISGTPKALPRGYILAKGHFFGPQANLYAASASNLQLNDIDLDSANLQLGDFHSSEFRNANFQSANLQSANLSQSVLTGANLDNADLRGARLEGVTSGGITGSLAWSPDNWKLEKGYLIGPGANLEGADLRGLNLKYLDLSGANLANTNLENQDLSGSALEGVNFAGANLQGIRGNDLIGQPSVMPLGWAYITNHFVGRGAHLNSLYLGGSFDGIDLTGSDLSGAHVGGTFSGANLSNCNINEADFSNTDLSGVIGENVQGRPSALPRLWNLVDGKFLRMFELQRLPALKGEFKVGKTAKIELGIWSDSPTLSISWFRDGVLLPSQHSTAIEITSDDVGHKFSAVIKATKTGFEDRTVTTTESSQVVKAMFTGSVTPKINGIGKVGKTLSVSSKAWAVGALQKFQWMLDGKAIKGLVSSQIAVSTKYKGHKLSVSVTQSLPGYVPLTKYSSSIKIG